MSSLLHRLAVVVTLAGLAAPAVVTAEAVAGGAASGALRSGPPVGPPGRDRPPVVVPRAPGAGPGAVGARTRPGGPPAVAGRPPAVGGTAPAPPATVTTLATALGTIPTFAGPAGRRSGSVPATWHGAPSTLPVLAEVDGWDEVRLAPRPNGSTGWVRAADVRVTETPWAILVDLATTHLYLFDGGRLVMEAPVGVGTAADPTPTGTFFVAYLGAPPSPGYGPFVVVTSAHSDAITDWERSGDALVAIHGPLGADRAIGRTGAALSHGCIRLHVEDLLALRPVPAGSPVVIVAGRPG